MTKNVPSVPEPLVQVEPRPVEEPAPPALPLRPMAPASRPVTGPGAKQGRRVMRMVLPDQKPVDSPQHATQDDKETVDDDKKKAANAAKKNVDAPKRPVPVAMRPLQQIEVRPKPYAQPFCDFLTKFPTVYHCVDRVGQMLKAGGFKKISERDMWKLEKGGKYFVERNGSSLIAFSVGEAYEPGNGVAMIAGHVDALTVKLKPIPKKDLKAGYIQLGVAPYAGGLNNTWWDRDLGLAGRVLVRNKDGSISIKLVNINRPFARIPTLAPHYGRPALGPFNPETQMVPIIGLGDTEAPVQQRKAAKEAKKAERAAKRAERKAERKAKRQARKEQRAAAGDNEKAELIFDQEQTESSDVDKTSSESSEGEKGQKQKNGFVRPHSKPSVVGGTTTFTSTQPPKLVEAIAKELGESDHDNIVGWDLELYDVQPAQIGGLDGEFIFGGRLDDKLCSWAAVQALLGASCKSDAVAKSASGIIQCVALFDNEEIGSLLRQGARGNFLPSTLERVVDSFSEKAGANLMAKTYANSFLISADNTHAVNPNFLEVYLPQHSPRLNVGVGIAADPNGHMTTDAVSAAILHRVAEKCGSTLQVSQIRNDSRSGGTVGPMLSSAMGVRAIDAGIPQLSMHSIRATTGSQDPGLGVKLFKGFFDHFESVDKEFVKT